MIRSENETTLHSQLVPKEPRRLSCCRERRREKHLSSQNKKLSKASTTSPLQAVDCALDFPFSS